MTVEQLAEQYAGNIELDTKWNNPRQVIEQAYIAGYNEAQNTITQCNRSALSGVKWHKVADGDLPNNTDNVLSDKGTIVYYNFTYDCWVDERTSVKIDDVIAWCEIPKFNVVVL